MIGRTFISTAALTLASQLGNLRQNLGETALPQSDPTAPAPTDATGLLGRAVLDVGSSVLLREVRHGAVPELERSLRIIANQTPVEPLSLPRALETWNGIAMTSDSVWVDIGSGNGDSLGRLARKHPGRFIGVDKENSEALFYEVKLGAKYLESLPDNARYLVLSYNRPGSCMVRHERVKPVPMRPWNDRPSDADMVMDATVESVGEASAQVVSLVFPYSESRRRTFLGRVIQGPRPDLLDYQLKTAVRLLRPGGLGVAVLESTETAEKLCVAERAVKALRTHPELRWIGYTPQGFQVETLGLAPYAPRDEGGRSVDTQPLREGKAVFFRKKD